jgi:hypothetical protein
LKLNLEGLSGGLQEEKRGEFFRWRKIEYLRTLGCGNEGTGRGHEGDRGWEISQQLVWTGLVQLHLTGGGEPLKDKIFTLTTAIATLLSPQQRH